MAEFKIGEYVRIRHGSFSGKYAAYNGATGMIVADDSSWLRQINFDNKLKLGLTLTWFSTGWLEPLNGIERARKIICDSK